MYSRYLFTMSNVLQHFVDQQRHRDLRGFSMSSLALVSTVSTVSTVR